ncbi:helix-turn-helix transcriptional regulator [Subtercola sp. YIM 133946]|uniref:helix-turn-helix transcriptional regulator n=1 Tax=Subtercola sp. YIM 133946 TaxID=3118909 RepID=UPI002F953E6A
MRVFQSEDDAFAVTFRRARERKGLTQEDVARHMTMRGYDFHQQTVYKIESGKRKVTVGEGVALAELVHIPVESLADRFPDSPESLANDVRRAGRDYAEDLFNTAANMIGLRSFRAIYLDAVQKYAEHPTAWVEDPNGDRVPMTEVFLSLAMFPGIGDYLTAWKEPLANPAARATLKASGWDPDEEEEFG